MQVKKLFRSVINLIALLSVFMFFPESAFSASWDCKVITSALTIPFPSTLVIQRDTARNTAVGQPISDWVTTGSHEIYDCTWYGGGSNYNILETLTASNTGGTYSENGITYKIHPTNLAGVGIVVQAISSSSHSSSPSTYDFPWSAGTWAGSVGYSFSITATFQASARLIKTASTVNGGNMTEAQVGTLRTEYQPPTGSYWYTVPISYGGTNVVIASCSVDTPNVNVPLGEHLTTEFTKVGYTTATKDVPVSLDCNAGTRVNVVVQATADTTTTQQGAIKLNSGGATGIAVQLMDKNSTGVKLNQKFLVDTVASEGQYNFNWTAHYLQTSPTVTTGDANTLVTLALSYE